jgi:hypothetical protein
MMYYLADFKPAHAREIIKRNGKDLPLPQEKLIEAYLSPGSVALTILADDIPIACGGIINQDWHNGEAWLLTAIEFGYYRKTAYRFVKEALPLLAQMGDFKRVQAHSYDREQCAIFKHLGFQFEGVIRRFTWNNRDAFLFSRLFPEDLNGHPA